VILEEESMIRPPLFVFCVVLGLMPIFLYPQPGQDDPEGKIIREIHFEGLERTKEYIVTRELILQVDGRYRKTDSEEEYDKLMSLDIFSRVRIEPVVIEEEVVLTYRFVETFPILPSPSVRISDENGLSLGGGVKSPNLLGRDIFFSGRVLFGGSKELELWIVNPWVTGNHLGYSLEYYHRERDNKITESYEISNELYLRISSHLGKRGRIGGGFESLHISSEQPGTTLDPDGSDQTARFTLFLGYDSRDAFPDTRRGWWGEAVIGYDSRLFNSHSDFYQVDLDIRRYQPLPLWDRHSLAIYSLTTMRTGQIGEDVAPWQAFGIGGTNTVRGWEFASRRGKNQFINTVEYRITLLEPRMLLLPLNIKYRGGLSVALFGDVGIGWGDHIPFSAENFIGGFGLGVRLLIPIVGVMRIDVGWGQSGKGIFLHLGAFEKPVMTRKRVR
jgi:outer membrane protein insertion porin family